jgi:hypothetical protein
MLDLYHFRPVPFPTVDNAKQTVTFWGQSNKTIVVAWKELGYPW